MATQQQNIDRQIFESLGEDLPQSLADAIQEAADYYIEVAKSNMNFKQNSSGGVRDSIRAVVDDAQLTLGIFMPEHGYFQNFGVVAYENGKRLSNRGKLQSDQEPLDEATAEAFGAAPGSLMQFGTGNYWKGGPPWGAYYTGINAKRFLNIEQFIDQVVDYVNNNLEL